MERAVIDRFEGPYAVLLIGEQQIPIDVPRSQLPPTAREGHWLQVDLIDGTLISASIDHAATDAAKQRIQDKRERLHRGDHLRQEE
jgi:hypothetical protein